MYLNGIYSVRHWICVAMFHNVKRWGNMDNSHLRVNSLEMDGWMDGWTDGQTT